MSNQCRRVGYLHFKISLLPSEFGGLDKIGPRYLTRYSLDGRNVHWRLYSMCGSAKNTDYVLIFQTQTCHNLPDNCRGANSTRLETTTKYQITNWPLLSFCRFRRVCLRKSDVGALYTYICYSILYLPIGYLYLSINCRKY